MPVTIALLLCALLNPGKRFLVDHGWQSGLASTIVFVGGVLLVAGIVTLVVEQFATGSADLAAQVGTGLDTVQNWLVTGPLNISQDQIDSVVNSIKQVVLDNRSGAVTTATSVGRVITGLVLVMLILFFFLRDGRRFGTGSSGWHPAGPDRRSAAPPTGPGGHWAVTSEPPSWSRSSMPLASGSDW